MKPPESPMGGGSAPRVGEELVETLQSLCVTSRGGVLEVHSEFGTGKIAFRSGRVLHAQLAGLQGEAAFSKMVGAVSGDFRLLPEEAEETVSIFRPWEDLLIETISLQESDRETEAEEEAESELLFQLVRKMKLTEKLRFALRCGKEGRTLLIRDPNRAVQLAIISNPRITDSEVALIAWSRSIGEEVLRRIAENREWARHYPVRLALATNPKTPIAIATKLLPTLQPKDVSQIAKSKDVSALIAHGARRLLLQRA
jgi:hypothetical protein